MMAWSGIFRVLRTTGLALLLFLTSSATTAATNYDLNKIALTTISGESSSMADFGDRVLIINFWASWCPPCVKELPDLEEMAEQIDPQRYQVLLISVDANPDNGQQMLDKLGITLPAFVDPKMEVANGHFKVLGFPETIIIKPSGELVSRFLGPKEWADPALWQKILP